jgi:hypothetical protein
VDGGRKFAQARLMDDQRKRDILASVYIIWHISKERGRRIFQKESMPADALAGLIRADLELLVFSKRRDMAA